MGRVELRLGEKNKEQICYLHSIRWKRPHGGGPEFESNSIDIIIYKNGHLAFSSPDGESWIYFYPEQIKHLRIALRKLPRRKKK